MAITLLFLQQCGKLRNTEEVMTFIYFCVVADATGSGPVDRADPTGGPAGMSEIVGIPRVWMYAIDVYMSQ